MKIALIVGTTPVARGLVHRKASARLVMDHNPRHNMEALHKEILEMNEAPDIPGTTVSVSKILDVPQPLIGTIEEMLNGMHGKRDFNSFNEMLALLASTTFEKAGEYVASDVEEAVAKLNVPVAAEMPANAVPA